MLLLTVTYHLSKYCCGTLKTWLHNCLAWCLCMGMKARQKECEISFLQICTNFTSGIILLLFDIIKEHKICMFTMVYRHVMFIYARFYTVFIIFYYIKVRRSCLKYTWIYVNILLLFVLCAFIYDHAIQIRSRLLYTFYVKIYVMICCYVILHHICRF